MHVDNKDPTRYVLDLQQGGLTLPDRDYYLLNDEKMNQARVAYSKSLQKMFTLAGDKNAATEAAAVIALETKIAKIQWRPSRRLLRIPASLKATSSRCRLDRDVPRCRAKSAAYQARSGCNKVADKIAWRVRGMITSMIRRALLVRILRHCVRLLRTNQMSERWAVIPQPRSPLF